MVRNALNLLDLYFNNLGNIKILVDSNLRKKLEYADRGYFESLCKTYDLKVLSWRCDGHFSKTFFRYYHP